jgi:hypothetical protein
MPNAAKKKVGWEGTTTGGDMDEEDELLQEQFGFKREKSECLLL